MPKKTVSRMAAARKGHVSANLDDNELEVVHKGGVQPWQGRGGGSDVVNS